MRQFEWALVDGAALLVGDVHAEGLAFVGLAIEGCLLLLARPVSLDLAPVALGLNQKCVDAHLHLEETVVAPGAAPGVAYDPCLNAVDDCPADDTNVVVDLASCVVLDVFGVFSLAHEGVCVHSAHDRPVLLDLVHHGFNSADGPPVLHRENVVRGGNAAAGVREAVEAFELRGAGASVVQTECLLVGAVFFSEAVVLDLLQQGGLVSTRTAVVVSDAGDDHLRRQVDYGEGRIARDVDAVGECGRGRHCPAGTALLGDVLVAHERGVVGAVHVAPVMRIREC